jgi:hypothetical protein
MKGPETAIKDKIRAWLRTQGAYVFSPTQMGYGLQTLDLLVCFCGYFYAIEVKAPGKKLTARQALIADDIGNAGGRVIVARSLDDVVRAIFP